jgi:hypothetical protein
MIAIVGRGRRVEYRVAPDQTKARLPTGMFQNDWMRLVVKDDAGRMAWSNPVWLD